MPVSRNFEDINLQHALFRGACNGTGSRSARRTNRFFSAARGTESWEGRANRASADPSRRCTRLPTHFLNGRDDVREQNAGHYRRRSSPVSLDVLYEFGGRFFTGARPLARLRKKKVPKFFGVASGGVTRAGPS